MGFFDSLFGFNKPGPGVEKDEPPKPAPVRFFVIYFRKFWQLVQLNLIFVLPALLAAALMFLLYLCPYHFLIRLPVGDGVFEFDAWTLYVVPLPLIPLSTCVAGLTIVTRNFSREEHAFVWSDFWEAVAKNWKLFLPNGAISYAVYVVLSFAVIYYYQNAAVNSFYYVLFGFSLLLFLCFLFMQYYLPVMFVTFDLKLRQFYRNAAVFIFAGLFRNLLVTVILAAVLIVLFGIVPIMPLTVLIMLLLAVFLLFSFIAYLINFTVYPVIERYMIQPYEQKLAEEKAAAEYVPDPVAERFTDVFRDDSPAETAEEDRYVYVNGKLVKESSLKEKEND